MSSPSLYESLSAHAAYFQRMVTLVPPECYVAVAENESKYWVNKKKKRKAPKQLAKEASKKAKRLKLDPNAQKSIIEMQKEKEEDEKKESSSSKPNSSSLAELQRRLQQRIAEARTKRNAKRETVKTGRVEKTKVKSKSKAKKAVVKSAPSRITQSQRKDGNRKENLVFSNLDVKARDPAELVKEEVRKSRKRNKKDPKKLLAVAEKRRKVLDELSARDEEKAEKKGQEVMWKKAESMAKGVKQLDDVGLLQKAVKRKEKLKAKSESGWKKRVETQQLRQTKQQELRKKHIKERIVQKRKRKAGKRR
ncbi:surfeit locus protein 6 homolog [Oscarella lobularis]|uniref:surfeit locus protein 6 homolog n=1 Tax=Oscarella lobularis TaxID=121494 RepID=UPI003313C308